MITKKQFFNENLRDSMSTDVYKFLNKKYKNFVFYYDHDLYCDDKNRETIKTKVQGIDIQICLSDRSTKNSPRVKAYNFELLV